MSKNTIKRYNPDYEEVRLYELRFNRSLRHREAALATVAIQNGIEALDLNCFASLEMTCPACARRFLRGRRRRCTIQHQGGNQTGGDHDALCSANPSRNPRCHQCAAALCR